MVHPIISHHLGVEAKVRLNIYSSFNLLRCLLRTNRDGASSSKANNKLDVVINSNEVISTDLKLEHYSLTKYSKHILYITSLSVGKSFTCGHLLDQASHNSVVIHLL